MANKKATFSKNTKINSKWLSNAMKSIGLSTKEYLTNTYPSITEVGSTAAVGTKNMITALRQNKATMHRITESLKQNKYVQVANKAFNNALSDLKTGKLNNNERDPFGDFGFDDFDSDAAFSFGDDDTDESGGANIQYIDTGSRDAVLSLSKNVTKQSEAMMKTNKASMDAYVSMTAATLYQLQQMSSEINTGLTNINNSLQSLVEFNNTTMTKFIEASMATYDRMGASKSNDYSFDDGKITLNSVFNGNGGMNLSSYKKYAKQQLKKTITNGDAGFIISMLDENMLDMVAANPLSFVTSGLVSYMMPKILGTTIDGLEKTFQNFLPAMLNKLADKADDYSAGLVTRFLGKAFGLKSGTTKGISLAKVEKGPIPFDGETKHAITEIITKELREQTAYLKAIADKTVGKDEAEKYRKNAKIFDYNANDYVTQSQIAGNITKSVYDAVISAWRENNGFDSKIRSVANGQEDEKVQKRLNRLIDEVEFLASTAGQYVEIGNRENAGFQQILAKMQENSDARRLEEIDLLMKKFEELRENDITAYNQQHTSRIKAGQAYDNSLADIEKNSSYYNLRNAGFSNAQLENMLDTTYKSMRKRNVPNRHTGFTNVEFSAPDGTQGLLHALIDSPASHVNGIMNNLIAGNSREAFTEFTRIFTDQVTAIGGILKDKVLNPLKVMLVGTEDENGYKKGGLLSGVRNGMSDIFGHLRYQITGKGWKDSKGVTYEDSDTSVVATLKNMAGNVKNGIMEKLFGRMNENGEREKGGILSKFTDTFKKGLDGWKSAFLGEDVENMSHEEISKKMADKLHGYTKDATVGAAIGAGTGALAGGSLLGTLVGGPIGGAAMGLAVGILNKGGKIQDWLFGEKDSETGERYGGFIKKETQDYIKKNKGLMVGGGAVGALTSILAGKSGGLLGSLVGGPIVGAGLGIATTLVTRSEKFKEFFFGNEEKGKEGIINAIKNGFKRGAGRHGNQGEEINIDAKVLGMSGIGILGGILTSAVLPGGPIIGALAGLGASIAANGKTFKEFLFGADDPETGKHKHGIFGRFGNMLNANLLRPLKTKFSYYAKTVALDLEYAIGDTVSDAAHLISEKVGDVVGTIKERFGAIANAIGTGVKKNFIDPIVDIVRDSLVTPITTAVKGAATLVFNTARSVALAPFMLVRKGMDIFKNRLTEWWQGSKVKHFIDAGKEWLKDRIKRTLKFIARGVVGTFKAALFLPRMALKGVGALLGAGGRLIGRGYDRIRNRAADGNVGDAPEGMSFAARRAYRRRLEKEERAKLRRDYKEQKIRDKNAKLIAKATKGQYSVDSAEARAAAKLRRPGIKLDESVKTEDQIAREAKERIEGVSVVGKSLETVMRMPFSKLNENSQIVWVLSKMLAVLDPKYKVSKNATDAIKKFAAEAGTLYSKDDLIGGVTNYYNMLRNNFGGDKNALDAYIEEHGDDLMKYVRDSQVPIYEDELNKVRKQRTLDALASRHTTREERKVASLREQYNTIEGTLDDLWKDKLHKKLMWAWSELKDSGKIDNELTYPSFINQVINNQLIDQTTGEIIDIATLDGWYFGGKGKLQTKEAFIAKSRQGKTLNKIANKINRLGGSLDENEHRARLEESVRDQVTESLDNEAIENNARDESTVSAMTYKYNVRNKRLSSWSDDAVSRFIELANEKKYSRIGLEFGLAKSTAKKKYKSVLKEYNNRNTTEETEETGETTEGGEGYGIGGGRGVIGAVLGGARRVGKSVKNTTRKVANVVTKPFKAIGNIGNSQAEKAESKQRNAFFAAISDMKDNLSTHVKNAKDHFVQWGKTFAKKGAITLALLTAAPLIMKAGRSVISFLGGQWSQLREKGPKEYFKEVGATLVSKLETAPVIGPLVNTLHKGFNFLFGDNGEKGFLGQQWAELKDKGPKQWLLDSIDSLRNKYPVIDAAMTIMHAAGQVTYDVLSAIGPAGIKAIGTGITTIGKGLVTLIGFVKSIASKLGFAVGERTNGMSYEEAKKETIDDEKKAAKEFATGHFIKGTKDWIYGSDGEWDSESEAKAKFLINAGKSVPATLKFLPKAGKAAYKGAEKVFGVAGHLPGIGGKVSKATSKLMGGTRKIAGGAAKAIGNSRVATVAKAAGGKVKQAAINKIDDAAAKVAGSKVGTAVKGVGTKLASSKVGTAVKGVGTKLASSKVGTAVGKGKDVVTKVMTKIKEWIVKVIEKVSAKSGAKIASNCGDDAARAVEKGLEQGAKNPTFTAKLTAGLAKAASIIQYATIAYGALNGITAGGAAKLFQVDQKDVDGGMRIIAAVIGGFAGSGIGSLVDLVNSLVESATGYNFISSLAITIYKFFGGSKNAEKLDKAREDFKVQYEEYKQDEMRKAFDKAVADNTLPDNIKAIYDTQGEDAAFDAYLDAVERGEIEVDYDSFADFNAKKNKSLAKKIGEGAKKLGKKVSDKAKKMWDSIKKNPIGTIAGAVAGGPVGAIIANTKVGKAIGNKVKSVGKGVATWAGNRVDDLKTGWASIANTAKDKWQGFKDNWASGVEGLSDMWKNFKSDAGDAIKVVKDRFADFGNGIKERWSTFVTGIKSIPTQIAEHLTKLKNKIFGGIKSIKTKVLDILPMKKITELANGLKEKFTGAIDGIKEKFDSIKNSIKDGWNNVTSFFTGGNGIGIGGGRGDDSLNGFAYYSQNDSRWKNSSYSDGYDNATMGDSGCGPAAMSMITSQMTGRNVNPRQMASFAQATGDRDSTGTNWNFINKASSAFGISSRETITPSADYVASELAQGHPMILSGASGGYGASPYTPAGHYVVATGIDGSGNISINDPRGKQYSGKYRLNDVVNDTGAAWAFGGGYGSAYENKVGTVEADLNGDAYRTPVNNLSRGQCTWYAEGRAYEKYGWQGVKDQPMGNGGEVYANALSKGYPAGTEIKPNSLVSRSGSSSYGHVLFVEDVDRANDKVYYSEANSDGSGHAPDDGVIKVQSLKEWNARNPYGYVYTDGSDGNSSSSSNSSDVTTAKKKGTESVLSVISQLISEMGTRAVNGLFTGNWNSNYRDFLASLKNRDAKLAESSDSSTVGSGSLSNQNKSITFVGDSRTVGMYASVAGDSSKTGTNTPIVGKFGKHRFIAKVGVGDSWFRDQGAELVRNNLQSNGIIVIWLGVNNLSPASYIDIIKEQLSGKVNGNKIYYLSVGPCDGSYSHLNSEIVKFNGTIKSLLPPGVKFIDIYGFIKDGLDSGKLGTNDGLHYNAETYQAIYTKVLNTLGVNSGGSGRRAVPTRVNNFLRNIGGFGRRLIGGGRGSLIDYFTSTFTGDKTGYSRRVTVDPRSSGQSYDYISDYFSPGRTYRLGSVTELKKNNSKQAINKYMSKINDYEFNYLNDNSTNSNLTDSPTGESRTWKFVNPKNNATYSVQFPYYSSPTSPEKKNVMDKVRKALKGAISSNSKDSIIVPISEFSSNVTQEEKENSATGVSAGWIATVQAVKRIFAEQLAAAGFNTDTAYDNVNFEFDFGNKGKKKFRRDCTGFISACLWVAGIVPDEHMPTGGFVSYNFGGSANNDKLIADLAAGNFTRMDFPGWNNLQKGDILIKHEHHGEIYCSGNSASQHQSWNCGSGSGLLATDTVYGANYDYEEIWRPDGSVGGSTVNGSAGKESKSVLTVLSSMMSEIGTRAINGIFTGNWDSDYNSFLSNLYSQDSGDSSESTGDTNAVGNTVKEKIWNSLRGNGFTKQAAAGVMGNMQQESSFNPAAKEGGENDGGGLIQWSPWNTTIGAYAQEERGDKHAWEHDVDLQMKYLYKRLPGEEWAFRAYPSKWGAPNVTIEEFKAGTNVENATKQFEAGMERSADTATGIAKRVNFAQKIFDEFKDYNYTPGYANAEAMSKIPLDQIGRPVNYNSGTPYTSTSSDTNEDGEGTTTHISSSGTEHAGSGGSFTGSGGSFGYGTIGRQGGGGSRVSNRRVSRGGYGMKVNVPSYLSGGYGNGGIYENISAIQYDNSANSYKSASQGNKVISNQANTELLSSIVDILQDIAMNTAVSSDKLDMLKNIGRGSSTTNIITNGGNGTGAVKKPVASTNKGTTVPKSNAQSRNTALVARIAQGV
jgi:hypothetical protein